MKLHNSLIRSFGAIALPLLLAQVTTPDAFACEIAVKVKSNPKPSYQTGDVVVFEVTVFLTHNDCPEGIKATKFTGVGLDLLGATKWKEISTGTYIRLVKATVTAAKDGAGALHARRKCDKEGGYGVVTLAVPSSDDEEL
jgi:hypothetical protein